MYFAIAVGQRSACERWRENIAVHATWLGLDAKTTTRTLRDGRLVIESTYGAHDGAAVSDLEITVSGEGIVRVTVPLATPQQCFHARFDGDLYVADDLRLLARQISPSLDPRGLYALLQHGAVPAPFSIYREISRVPAGHTWTSDVGLARHLGRVEAWSRAHDAAGPEATIGAALDRVLAVAPARSTVFFSGGVDSALLATRLVGAGRRDLELVNYRFGSDDPESRHASVVAAHLGLPLRFVDDDPTLAPAILARIARDYAVPFGDFSTLPTNALAHAVVGARCVIDGTGADGAFAVGAAAATWRRIAAIPRPVRASIARALRTVAPWYRTDGVERLWRVLARSAALPIPLAAITAQNSLEGVLYRTPASVSAELGAAFATYLDPFSDAAVPEDRLAVLDLIHVCAGQFAAKSSDVLRRAGARALFPYLSPDMIGASFAVPWRLKCANGEPKAILKRMLARHLPRELVYRRKSGFIPPFARVLARPAVGALVSDTLLSSTNPLRDVTDHRRLTALVQRVRAGGAVSYATLCVLWVSLFTTLWLTRR